MKQFVQKDPHLKYLNNNYKYKYHKITFYKINYKDVFYKKQIYKIINECFYIYYFLINTWNKYMIILILKIYLIKYLLLLNKYRHINIRQMKLNNKYKSVKY